MILYIIKKVILIYLSLSFFVFPLFSFGATTDLAEFCFVRDVNLQKVKSEIEFLMLPKEKIILRPEQSCIDVLVESNERIALINKFLSRRYQLRESREGNTGNEVSMEKCQVEFRAIQAKSISTKKTAINVEGKAKGNIEAANEDLKETTISTILMDSGKSATLEVTPKELRVTCLKTMSGIFQLSFSYAHIGQGKVSSEISVKKGEVVNVGDVVQDLNKKAQKLGLPETELAQTEGQQSIKYELEIK